jgi:hypothetical protein
MFIVIEQASANNGKSLAVLKIPENALVSPDAQILGDDADLRGYVILDASPLSSASDTPKTFVERAIDSFDQPATTAFKRLLLVYQAKDTYQQRTAIMRKAVQTLGEEAAADDLYEFAYAKLSMAARRTV